MEDNVRFLNQIDKMLKQKQNDYKPKKSKPAYNRLSISNSTTKYVVYTLLHYFSS